MNLRDHNGLCDHLYLTEPYEPVVDLTEWDRRWGHPLVDDDEKWCPGGAAVDIDYRLGIVAVLDAVHDLTTSGVSLLPRHSYAVADGSGTQRLTVQEALRIGFDAALGITDDD